MRAPILIVIFDFLVGSLLLFVVAPDTGYRAVPTTGPGGGWSASEFAPEAVIAFHETAGLEWDRLWTEQRLAESSARNRELQNMASDAEQALTKTNRELANTLGDLHNSKLVAATRATEIAILDRRLTEEKAARSAVEKQRALTDYELRAAQQQLDAIRKEQADLGVKLANSEITRDELRKRTADLKEQLAAADKREEGARQSAAEMNRRLAENSAQIAATNAQIAKLSKDLNRTAADIKGSVVAVGETTHAALEKNAVAIAELQKQTTTQQLQLRADVGKLDMRIAALPENLRKELEPLQQLRTQLARQSELLIQSNAELREVLTSEEVQRIAKQFHELGQAQATLQIQLQTASETAATALGSETVRNIDAQLNLQRDKLAVIGASIEQISARRQGPYQAVFGARCEVSVSMEKTGFISNDHTTRQVFPLLFSAGTRRFVAIYHSNIALDWKPLIKGGEISSLRLTYGSPPGDNRWSTGFQGSLLALAAEPRLVLLEVTDNRANGVAARPIVGRAAIMNHGVSEAYLVKVTVGAPVFRIEASVNQANRNQLTVRTAPIPLMDQLPIVGNKEAQAEAGDHLVTVDGRLIGVMISDRSAYILDGEDVDNIAVRLPFTDALAFVSAAQKLRELAQ